MNREDIAKALVENLVASIDIDGMPIISGINTATTAILALPSDSGKAAPVACWVASTGQIYLLRSKASAESYERAGYRVLPIAALAPATEGKEKINPFPTYPHWDDDAGSGP